MYFTESGEKVRRRKLIANDILIILKNEFGIEVKDYFIDLDLLQLINSVKRMYSGDDNGVDLYKFVTKHIFVNLNIDEKITRLFLHYLFFINEVEDRIKIIHYLVVYLVLRRCLNLEMVSHLLQHIKLKEMSMILLSLLIF